MNESNFLTREEFKSSMESFLNDIKSILDKPTRKKKHWLRTAEAAEYLSISQSQLHKLKSEGIISCSKLGGTNYYDKIEIDKIIEENKNLAEIA